MRFQNIIVNTFFFTVKPTYCKVATRHHPMNSQVYINKNNGNK